MEASATSIPLGQPAWLGEAMAAFWGSLAKEIEPLRAEFQSVKAVVADHEKRLKLLEERSPSPARSVLSSITGSPAPSLVGSSVSTAASRRSSREPDMGGLLKIRGVCEFGQHAKDGIDRQAAELLVSQLLEHIPTTLRSLCAPIQLRDTRNFEVRIPVSSSAHVEEVRKWMNQVLKEDPAWQFNKRTLYVVPERPEAERPLYALMGKLKEGLHATRAAMDPELDWTFREFWAPHWKIIVIGPDKQEEDMLSNREGKAVWKEEAMRKNRQRIEGLGFLRVARGRKGTSPLFLENWDLECPKKKKQLHKAKIFDWAFEHKFDVLFLQEIPTWACGRPRRLKSPDGDTGILVREDLARGVSEEAGGESWHAVLIWNTALVSIHVPHAGKQGNGRATAYFGGDDSLGTEGNPTRARAGAAIFGGGGEEDDDPFVSALDEIQACLDGWMGLLCGSNGLFDHRGGGYHYYIGTKHGKHDRTAEFFGTRETKHRRGTWLCRISWRCLAGNMSFSHFCRRIQEHCDSRSNCVGYASESVSSFSTLSEYGLESNVLVQSCAWPSTFSAITVTSTNRTVTYSLRS